MIWSGWLSAPTKNKMRRRDTTPVVSVWRTVLNSHCLPSQVLMFTNTLGYVCGRETTIIGVLHTQQWLKSVSYTYDTLQLRAAQNYLQTINNLFKSHLMCLAAIRLEHSIHLLANKLMQHWRQQKADATRSWCNIAIVTHIVIVS